MLVSIDLCLLNSLSFNLPYGPKWLRTCTMVLINEHYGVVIRTYGKTIGTHRVMIGSNEVAIGIHWVSIKNQGIIIKSKVCNMTY